MGGASIVTASGNKSAKIWDAETGECRLTLSGHEDEVYSASYSPDGASIVTASDDKSAKIWDAETGECRLTLSGHEEGVNSASYSPDGAWSVTGFQLTGLLRS